MDIYLLIWMMIMKQDNAEKLAEQLNLRLERDRFGKRFMAVDTKEISEEISGFIVMLEE